MIIKMIGEEIVLFTESIINYRQTFCMQNVKHYMFLG